MGQLQDVRHDILELGYQILFVSPDRPEKIRAMREKKGNKALDYTILSDSDAAAATAFGIAFKVDDETIDMYGKYGIDLVDASGLDHPILPVPAVFILDRDQIVRFQYVDPNYKVRIDPELLLAAARASR